jgi:hypothetical protein
LGSETRSYSSESSPLVSDESSDGAHGLTIAAVSLCKPLDSRAETLAPTLRLSIRMARRWIRRLGLDRLDWRTCWKSLEFWLMVGSIILPGGFFLLLVPRHPLRVTIRRSS